MLPKRYAVSALQEDAEGHGCDVNPCNNHMQGSGKTLAFGLPILQLLLDEAKERREAEGADEASSSGREDKRTDGLHGRNKSTECRRLKALILAPTR